MVYVAGGALDAADGAATLASVGGLYGITTWARLDAAPVAGKVDAVDAAEVNRGVGGLVKLD